MAIKLGFQNEIVISKTNSLILLALRFEIDRKALILLA